MQFNIKKSSIMWFSRKSTAVSPPSVLLNNVPLSCVCKQKYLGVTFDTRLNWSFHVANVCKNISYYLNLINPHVKSLPSHIVKMLVESLVFSRYIYTLPVWGPAIHQDSLTRLSCLQNRAVRMTCNLHKYDHIRAVLGWLSTSSFVQYCSLLTMYHHHYLCKSIVLL